MKAAERVNLSRTVGDTDPFLMKLTIVDDDDTLPVPDDASVVMHIATAPVRTLNGVSNDTDDGRFSFATTSIADLAAGNYDYEIEVTDGGIIYTQARGRIANVAQIG